MCAQLWVSKAQVGCGEGLELVVVEGRVPRSRPGCRHCPWYPTRGLGCMPGRAAPARAQKGEGGGGKGPCEEGDGQKRLVRI
jgi:hypothetical protein